MRVTGGFFGDSQHLGAMHSFAHGHEQAMFANSISAFLSSSVPVINEITRIEILSIPSHFKLVKYTKKYYHGI